MHLIFFDLESTGADPQADRITEVSIVREGRLPFSQLVNPGRPIPPNIAEITGITDEMVLEAPRFEVIAPAVAEALAGGFLAGFGIHQYDVPLLAAEFERAGVTFDWPESIDVGALDKIARPRNLTAAVSHWCNRSHAGAHRAEADAVATRDVLFALLGMESMFRGKSPEELATISRYGQRMADPAGRLTYADGRLCFAFGKHQGKPVEEEQGYAAWMLSKDFPTATKRMLRAELQRIEDRDFADGAIFADGEQGRIF